MGIWSVVKHVINGTLGTKDFMSLDKIIRNQYRLVPNNNVYEELSNIELQISENVSAEKEHPKKIRILNPSTLRITGTIFRFYAMSQTFSFLIIKNNNTVYEFSRGREPYNTDDYRYRKFQADIPCNFGDILSFKLTGHNSAGASASLDLVEFAIRGDVVNNIYEEVVE